MGVTIHYTLMQEAGRVKQTLDLVEERARAFKKHGEEINIPVEIYRQGTHSLFVNVEGCETLGFEFKRHGEIWYDWRKEYGKKWQEFDQNENNPHYQRWPEQVSYWASGSCKTQYAYSIYAHYFVAELVRECASLCRIASVDDEGEYYHTKVLQDAHKAIVSNGAMIDRIGGMLKEEGHNVIKGGETHIKNTKKYE